MTPELISAIGREIVTPVCFLVGIVIILWRYLK